MKRILLILSLVFSNFYFADPISTNCLNAEKDFTALQNSSETIPLGNIPILIGAPSFDVVSRNLTDSNGNPQSVFQAANVEYRQYLNGNAPVITIMANERLCFQDMNSSIESNISSISSNTASISALTNMSGDNLMQFKKLSSGVASSIAISNVDYADEGWSIGVGAGNFNSETEYAFGLSFASENTSFKIATSKDSSALGVNYKFGR